MSKPVPIEYAECFVRDVQDNKQTTGRFTLEIEKFLGEKWFHSTPIHLLFNLVPGITADDVGKRFKIVLIPLDKEVDREEKV